MREHGMADVRWEIYSLGATMYFLLTGVALSAETAGNLPSLRDFQDRYATCLSKCCTRIPIDGQRIWSCLER